MPLTEINHTLETFHDLIEDMGDKVDGETRNRRIGNLIGAVLLAAVLLLAIVTASTAQRAKDAANTANSNAKTLAVKTHADAVARCQQTNDGRANLRALATSLTDNLSGIVALAAASPPPAGQTAAEHARALQVLNTAQQSIAATRDNAVAKFPPLDCSAITP